MVVIPKKLLEIKREEMIDETREYSIARWLRRLNYTGKVNHYVGEHELAETGNFSILLNVGDYSAIVEFVDMKSWIDLVYPDGIPSRISTQNIINMALDELDLRVYCTCPDFKYRFHYIVTQYDSLPDGIPKQNVPTVITNPEEAGFLCKHLIAILVKTSSWTPKAITLLRSSIKYYRS